MSYTFPAKRKLEDDTDDDHNDLNMTEKTPVSVLQELCVQENVSVPMYEHIPHETDPKMFSYLVQAFDHFAKGSGRSKREAKHEASANLLCKFADFVRVEKQFFELIPLIFSNVDKDESI